MTPLNISATIFPHLNNREKTMRKVLLSGLVLFFFVGQNVSSGQTQSAGDREKGVTISMPLSTDMAARLTDEFRAGFVEGWQKFYLEEFGLKVNLSKLVIPPHRNGFDRLIVIVPGVTAQSVYNACAKHFKILKYKYIDESLDKEVPVNDRIATTRPYAVWIRDRQEADEELKNLSANELKKRNIFGETLTERLIHELKYFLETGKHLDVENFTLASGSRYSDGYVPYVSWSSHYDELYVDWDGPDYAHDSLRSREVVSVP